MEKEVILLVERVGYNVIGIVKSVKGHCHADHKVGDIIELDCHSAGGLCGFFYHDIFPTLTLLQFGGQYPWGDPDRVMLECLDKANAVTIELQRIK